jgi:hypothetical protein
MSGFMHSGNEEHLGFFEVIASEHLRRLERSSEKENTK